MSIENLVIVPVRVNLPMTARCVESAHNQDIPVTLMCIDNGTTDGCGPWLRANSDIVVSFTRPKGLSCVWNRMLAYAFDTLRLPWALVMNNDTILRPDTYRLLVEDGGSFVTAVGVSSMAQMGWIEGSPLGVNQSNEVCVNLTLTRRPHPDFSCFLIRHEVWERDGGFDEHMVSWCSDCDYHVRMYRAGIPACCISIPFYHIASGTLKHVDPETHEALCRQSDRDREAFCMKYGCLPGTPEYTELFK